MLKFKIFVCYRKDLVMKRRKYFNHCMCIILIKQDYTSKKFCTHGTNSEIFEDAVILYRYDILPLIAQNA